MINTDENYWDCECDQFYIVKRSTRGYCAICNSYADDQPDSRVDEIKLAIKEGWLEDD